MSFGGSHGLDCLPLGAGNGALEMSDSSENTAVGTEMERLWAPSPTLLPTRSFRACSSPFSIS